MFTVCRGRHIDEVERWWDTFTSKLNPEIPVVELPVSRNTGLIDTLSPCDEIDSLPKDKGLYFIIHGTEESELRGIEHVKDWWLLFDFHFICTSEQNYSVLRKVPKRVMQRFNINSYIEPLLTLPPELIQGPMDIIVDYLTLINKMNRKNAYYVETHLEDETKNFNPLNLANYLNSLIFLL